MTLSPLDEYPVHQVAMSMIGWFRRMAPVLPRKRASPKLKMPPSLATSQ